MNELTQTPPVADGNEPPLTRPGLVETWRERVSYQALSLGLVCALVAVALLLGNQLTHQRIVDAERQDRLAVLRQVLPQALYDNDPLADAFNTLYAVKQVVGLLQTHLQGDLASIVHQGFVKDFKRTLCPGLAFRSKVNRYTITGIL